MAPSKKQHPSATTTKPKSKPSLSEPPRAPPNWPAFKPLPFQSSLTLSSLLPSQILLIHNFWPASLCKNYVSFLKTLPLSTTPGRPKRGEALRVNDRFQIQDEGFARRLWEETGLREVVLGRREGEGNRQEEGEGDNEMSGVEREMLWGGEVIGLNPNIRIYRYTKGQFFDRHYDESNFLTLSTTTHPTPAETTWTLLLYLTSPATGCQGGETVFYQDAPKRDEPREIVVGLETGTLLLHKHGDECLLHEGREVTDGEKWVIRTDLCVRKGKGKGKGVN